MSLFRMPKVVARRLEKLQRDFLWGGGTLERKAHLVKWEVVCVDKEKGGLGIRKLALLNKALLGRWIWRFAFEKENLWKKVISGRLLYTPCMLLGLFLGLLANICFFVCLPIKKNT